MKKKNIFKKIFNRYLNNIKNKKIIFSGDISYVYPKELNLKNFKFHTLWFDQKILYKKYKIFFGLFKNNFFIKKCNILIFFWQKNKLENLFQMLNIFSFLNKNCKIFIIGNNKYGINKVDILLKKFCFLKNIDNLCHCKIFYGKIIKIPKFNIKNFWKKYKICSFFIKTLPGVFDYKKIDIGSKLLIQTLKKPLSGKIIEIGSGSGLISSHILFYNKNIDITLVDSYYNAIISSIFTLKINNFIGKVIASDVYSNINGKFDLIISNPPFHNKKKIDFTVSKKIIYESKNFLKKNGKLRIVGNNFLPYSNMIKKVFGKYKILLKNNLFTVYESINN